MHILMLEVSPTRGFAYFDDLIADGAEVSLVVERLDAYAHVAGFEHRSRAARIIEVPRTAGDVDLTAELAGRLGPQPVDGVFCITERCIPAAARLARGLGVPGEAVEVADLLRDKAAVRARLDAAGLGTVRWRRAASVEAGLVDGAALGLPVVVKPLGGYASVGVSVAWTMPELRAALAAGLTGRQPGARAEVLLEEYRFGREVSAEVLVQHGRPHLLGFAERLPAPARTTAELGGHFPANFEGRGAARRHVLDVVAALGVRNSPLHIELLMTPTGPALVEVNGRVVGHVVTRQMELALGRSLTRDLVALATGRPLDPVGEPVAVCALLQLWSPTNGRVRAVTLPDQLPAEVAEVEVTVRAGQTVHRLRGNPDRTGWVLARALTADRAQAAARRTADLIRIELEPEPTQDPNPTPVPILEPAPLTPPDPHDMAPHIALILGGPGLSAERVLRAAGAVTDHVSVLWCGSQQAGAAARELWAGQYHGTWYETSGGGDQAGPSTLVPSAPLLALGPDICPAEPESATVAVLLLAEGRLQLLGVLEQLGDDGAGHRTMRLAGSVDGEREAALLAAALAELAPGDVARGRQVGVLRYVAGPAGTELRWGLDDRTVALLDAGLSRDVVSTVVAAALGHVDLPERRPVAAVLRELTAPPGPLRVAEMSHQAELYDHPEVTAVDVLLPAGTVLSAAGADAAAGGQQAGPAHRPTCLWYVVTGDDEAACRDAAVRIESGVRLRHVPLGRTHVVVIDRTGGPSWSTDDGTPVLPPDRFRVTVLSGHAKAGADPAAPVDELHRIDVLELGLLAQGVLGVHRSAPVHRLSAGTERLLGPVAELRERLDLPGARPELARSVRDKAEMKRLARRAGLPHADGLVVHDAADALDLLERHGTIVLKPRDLSGSQGVTVCRDAAALDRWLRTTFVPGRWLAEEFVPGRMCHVDAVVHRGEVLAWDVSVYRQDTLAFSRGAPLSGVTADDPGLRDAARDLLDRVIDGWGLTDEVLHLEGFWNAPPGRGADHEPGRPTLTFCELAARAGGGGIVRAFRATRGIDLRHARLLLDAGDDPRRLFTEPVAAHAGYTVHYCSGGRLTAYDDSAVAVQALHRTVPEVGQTLPASAFSGTGLSTHVFAARTAEQVSWLTDRAEHEIKIWVEPAPSGHPSPEDNEKVSP